MTLQELAPDCRRFLEALHQRSGGDTTRQLSLYDVGADIGLDRNASMAAAQELMGAGLVEIRTLSGGIGISREGASMAGPEPDSAAGPTLGSDPFLDARRVDAVTAATAQVRAAVAAATGIPFETLSDLLADLRTIDAQLTSSKPKTGVVRACLESAGRLGKGLPEGEWRKGIARLLTKA